MKIFLTLIGLVLAFHTFGQQKVSGKVSDENGEPLPGASVFISNSKIGTTTDSIGIFKLSVPATSSFKLVISYIGYETVVEQLKANSVSIGVNIKMKPVSSQLKAVIITSKSQNGWKRWGSVFTDAFIGKSAFAAHCSIVNQDAIGFDYDERTKTLHAYASKPIIVSNEDMGYMLTLTLVDFTLDTSSNDVDYQVYSLFKEMTGDAVQQAQWKQNRLKAYSLSLMHFTRALYNNKLKEEGYEVRPLNIKENKEKERVQKLYRQKFGQYQDSLTNEVVANSFPKDSAKYYKKILGQEGKKIKLGEPLNVKDMIIKKDSNAILLNFKGQLQVVYKKIKEPQEYYNDKNHIALNTENIAITSTGINASEVVLPQKEYPFTEMLLLKGIPVEIKESGYINNTDLYMHGFWGWWEKTATKLPYEYEPQ